MIIQNTYLYPQNNSLKFCNVAMGARPRKYPDVINRAKKSPETATAAAALSVMAAGAIKFNSYDTTCTNELLKKIGLSAAEFKDGKMSLSTKENEAFYILPIRDTEKSSVAKTVLLKNFNKMSIYNLCGFKNYKECVDDLKRFDLVRKAGKIHSYELNTSVSRDVSDIMARSFSRYCHKLIKPKDIFFVESDAFYYDKSKRTLYSSFINLKTCASFSEQGDARQKYLRYKASRSKDLSFPTIYECKFITDEKGAAIGYEEKGWDMYKNDIDIKTYLEPQSPEHKLPKLAKINDWEEYAESFRFGNTDKRDFPIEGIQRVLNKLNRANISANSDDLQYVLYNDGTAGDKTAICYYNNKTGRTVVFNKNGDYLYQLEYKRTKEGSIEKCSLW